MAAIGPNANMLSVVEVQPGIRPKIVAAQQFTQFLPFIPEEGISMTYLWGESAAGSGNNPIEPAIAINTSGSGSSDQTITAPVAGVFPMSVFVTRVSESRWAEAMITEPEDALSSEMVIARRRLEDAFAQASCGFVPTTNAFDPIFEILGGWNGGPQILNVDADPDAPALTLSMFRQGAALVTAGLGRPDVALVNSEVYGMLEDLCDTATKTPKYRTVVTPEGDELQALEIAGIVVLRNDWIPKVLSDPFSNWTSQIIFLSLGPGLVHAITKPHRMDRLVADLAPITTETDITRMPSLIAGIAIGTMSAASVLTGFAVSTGP